MSACKEACSGFVKTLHNNIEMRERSLYGFVKICIKKGCLNYACDLNCWPVATDLPLLVSLFEKDLYHIRESVFFSTLETWPAKWCVAHKGKACETFYYI